MKLVETRFKKEKKYLGEISQEHGRVGLCWNSFELEVNGDQECLSEVPLSYLYVLYKYINVFMHLASLSLPGSRSEEPSAHYSHISLGGRVEQKHLGKRKTEESRKTSYFREKYMGGKRITKVKSLNIGNQSKVPRIRLLRTHLQRAGRS